MRRFPSGCTTDKHPLYSIFMGKLSQCVFKWDEDDLQLLTTAKREEMILQGVVNPSEKDLRRNLSSTELALHCKRVTRGTEETQTLISGLIQSLDGPKGCDTLGVPLFESERIAEVWRVQQQHVSCIQDPEGVHLYTQTGTLKKGGVSLPVYRCARGSTSLESFHLHMNRFIPGRKRYITHTAIPSNSIKFYLPIKIGNHLPFFIKTIAHSWKYVLGCLCDS